MSRPVMGLLYLLPVKIKENWTDHVRNEDVVLRVKEQRNIIHEMT
jgi:hypothetical protein